MGFFEKVKNMFTEEVEDDDVKVEQIKREVTHVAIESPNAKKEVEDDFQVKMNFVPEPEEKKPIFFDDNDFKDLDLEPKTEKKEEPEEKVLYGNRTRVETEQDNEKKIFKPTPIISPVYGVLDKNYHKEDIVSRNEVREEKNSQESPIDTIRNKAYGTLEDELENTLFGSNSILFKKEDKEDKLQVKEVDDDVLTDLTDDISKELDQLLVKKEKYIDDVESTKDDKVEEKNDDEDLLGFIDSTLYKDGDE